MRTLVLSVLLLSAAGVARAAPAGEKAAAPAPAGDKAAAAAEAPRTAA